MIKRKFLIPLGITTYFIIVLLACNLSTDNAPPTVVPRATNTPPPTIGYATLAPEELPQVATAPAPEQRTEAVLLTLLNQVQPDRMMATITALQNMTTRHMASGYDNTTRGIGGAAQYINDQFVQIQSQSSGRFNVTQQEFLANWGDGQIVGRNVIGVLSGTETGAGVIVVGGHYDSVSNVFDDPNAPAPGANDNASSIAALIEIARIMSQTPHRATILFVAFGAEEFQRQGSIAFVRDYLQQYNIPVNAMINMDIIGSSTAGNGATEDNRMRLYSANPNESPSRQFARMLNLYAERYVASMSLELQTGADREGRYSDHMSFSDAGIAAVRLIEYLEDSTRQHTNRDTVEAIRPAYLANATRTILASLTALASGPRAPRSVQLRDNGNGLRTLVWEISPDAQGYVVALREPGSIIYNATFETNTNMVEWEGFTPDRFEGIAIAGIDADGLMGPFSFEYRISN